ncbi:iron chelate uptake ABC transporter family permease subunit [Thaumasiovibrio subtropicus]|uniref:iron chelate uptake ABC transporter family permease subunit n=1 Tax=Thaumasiovibrio subtropicus TaxID=1891207 RepID=UPI000B351C55|nr:iron chelate uptake ABC transporter family permease subunit [Thaumasiovibrio subtropicus]
MRDRYKLIILAVAAIVITAVFLGKGLNADNYQFFLSRRSPKVLAIIFASIAIAVSSLIFQTITNNRILTPSIMGFDSLYLLTQVLIVSLFGGMSSLFIDAKLNFLASTTLMMLFSTILFGLYFRKKGANIFSLLLVGVVCGSLFDSIAQFLMMVMDPNEFMNVQDSMFASFNNVNGELVYWSMFPLALILIYLFKVASTLDVFWLGKDNATSLGINTDKVVRKMMFVIALLISISTALIGPVLFFGLIVVALTRQLFSSYQHSVLVTATSLLAVVMLLGGQWVVENLLGFQTTISVIINFFGGIYFLFLLLRNKLN